MSDYKPDQRSFDPTHATEYGEWGIHCVACGAMLSSQLRDPCPARRYRKIEVNVHKVVVWLKRLYYWLHPGYLYALSPWELSRLDAKISHLIGYIVQFDNKTSAACFSW